MTLMRNLWAKRGFAAHGIALLFCLSMADSAAAQATRSGSAMTLTPGGYVDITVPSGRARAVALELNGVSDPIGGVASFRLEAVRAGRVVGRKNIDIAEPGGVIVEHFQRPFDRIRLRDREGALAATVGMATFCGLSMLTPGECVTATGPSASEWVARSDDLPEAPGAISPDPSDPDPIAPSPETPTIVTTPTTEPTPTPGQDGDQFASLTPTDNAAEAPTPSPTDGGTPTDPLPRITEGEGDGEASLDTGITVPRAGGGVSDGDSGGAEIEVFSGPIFGEQTKIQSYDELMPAGAKMMVQAGPFAGVWRTATPWRDQAKVAATWEGRERGQVAFTSLDVVLNDVGMPIPTEAQASSPTFGFRTGELPWAFGDVGGWDDVAGTWRITSSPDVHIHLHNPAGGLQKLRETDTQLDFRCTTTNGNCAHNLVVLGVEPGSRATLTPPALTQLTDADGRPVADSDTDYMTREVWRRSNYGFNVVRLMDHSGATSGAASVIRFDEFPTVDYAIWGESAPKFSHHGREGRLNIKEKRGVQKSFTPIEARVRTAWDIGAIYHHNFPHLFLEHRGRPDPETIGDWAVQLWADSSIPEEDKLALLNDYELQHVDEFGREILRLREAQIAAGTFDERVHNTVLVEVSNETWNTGYPWNTQRAYFIRKAAARAEEMGRPAPTYMPNAVQTGYALTQAVARLRKQFPQVQWRGVMATQTQYTSPYRGDLHFATPGGAYNSPLVQLVRGYELFWQDYEANRASWEAEYAPEPELPGDWFEAQGTTYYSLAENNASGENVLAGFDRATFERRIKDEDEWPALRQEVLEWFIQGPQKWPFTGLTCVSLPGPRRNGGRIWDGDRVL